ncbi:hypothetical protein AAG906_033569 [Vitis piasezkii]
MALQESLAKFKKQQEKCQSTITSIAAKAGSSKPTVPQKFTPAAPTKPPTPAVKFSNDTERLQHINSIRKALLELRLNQAFTPEQINEACYVDTNANKAVFDSLRNNQNTKISEGIAVIDLKDSYPSVMEDLQALKAAGQVWLLSNFDSQEDIAYPNDPRCPSKWMMTSSSSSEPLICFNFIFSLFYFSYLLILIIYGYFKYKAIII